MPATEMGSFPPPQNPDNLGRGPLIMGLSWTVTGMAIIAVSLRMYVRDKRRIVLVVEDWMMFAAMLLQIVSNIFITISYRHGLGKHDTDLQLPNDLVHVLKYAWISLLPGVTVSILARLSSTILLIRIFGVHRWFKYYLVVFTSIQTLLSILVLVLTFAQYKPIEALWDPFILNRHRYNLKVSLTVMYLGQATYTLADISYVVLPVCIVWKLNMAINRRIALVFIMAASMLTAVFSILKILTFTGEPGKKINGMQYKVSLSALAANGEQAFVIILGCVPSLQPVLNIQLSDLRSIKASVTSIIQLRRNSASKSIPCRSRHSRDAKSDTSNGDYDIDFDARRIYNANHNLYEVDGPIITADDSASSKSLVPKGQARRVDEIAVSYSPSRRIALDLEAGEHGTCHTI